MIKKAPDTIYLQWFDELEEPALEATWCQDRINETDVEYIRVEGWPRAALEALKKVFDLLDWELRGACLLESYAECVRTEVLPILKAAIAAARGEEKDKQ